MKLSSKFSFALEKAKELTEKGKGKHHLGDFLPPEELKKFTAKVKAVKGESSLDSFDFSDYAEHKITESNIGYKMLQQAGWKEGMGLGSQGQGITAPVNRYSMEHCTYSFHVYWYFIGKEISGLESELVFENHVAALLVISCQYLNLCN